MATSKCNKCDKTSFEVVEKVPTRSTFKLLFVQCSSCGNVVGVMDYFNIGSMISKLEKRIEKIERKLG